MAPDLPGLAQQIVHFESRVQADPNSRAFLPLADLHRRIGELGRARDLLQQGLQRHPDFVTAKAALGLVFAELGESAEARKVLEVVLAADQDHLLALELLGREAADRGDWRGACTYTERLIRLRPEDRTVREAMREARRQVEQSSPPEVAAAPKPAADDECFEHLKPAQKRPPLAGSDDDSGGFETTTLAELYWRQGHPEKARIILERILSAEPDRADAREILNRLDSTAETTAAAAEARLGESAEASGSESAPARVGQRRGPDPDQPDLDRFRKWLDSAGDTRS